MTFNFHSTKRSWHCPPGVLIWKHYSTNLFQRFKSLKEIVESRVVLLLGCKFLFNFLMGEPANCQICIRQKCPCDKEIVKLIICTLLVDVVF